MVIRRGFHIEKRERFSGRGCHYHGGSVREVMDLVENAGGNILGVGVLGSVMEQ